MRTKTKRIALICSCVFVIIQIILMAQPASTSLSFAPGPDTIKVVHYSYFSFLELMGYANFGPPLTAICACIWLIISFWVLFFDASMKRRNILRLTALMVAFLSVLSLLTTHAPTVLGYLICIAAIAATVLQFVAYGRSVP